MRNFFAKEQAKIMALSACFAPCRDTNNYLIIVFSAVYIFGLEMCRFHVEKRGSEGKRERAREGKAEVG